MNHEEDKVDTPEQSEQEGESFEDASDTVKKQSPAMARTRSSTSGRSLTDRSGSQSGRPDSSGSPATTPADPPKSAGKKEGDKSDEKEEDTGDDEDESDEDEDEDEEEEGQEGEAEEQANDSAKKEKGGKEDEVEDTENVKTPRALKMPKASKGPPVTNGTQSTEGADEEEEKKDKDPAPLEKSKKGKERSGSFQEVDIDAKEGEDDQERGRQPHAGVPKSPTSTATSSKSRSTSRTQSISEKVANAASSSGFSLGSWGGFQKTTEQPAQPKKMSTSGAWGWLSRKKTTDNASPPQPVRTNTSTSNSKSDLKLSKLDTEPVPAKDQLKERFKLARMQEEAGINVDDLTETPRQSAPPEGSESGSRPTSEHIKSAASTPTVSEKPTSPSLEVPREPARRGHKPRTASLAQSISLDPGMTPGTVSGLSQGPSTMKDPQVPVDWDLWQSVVYEGPSAVAKTSPEDLSRSIAGGIPNPIRGVVWQVLAESKDESLEAIYHELIARGTDKEVTSPSQTPIDPPHSAKSLNVKERATSSASSVHSEKSGLASPTASTNHEGEANANASEADRQKKKKDEAAAVKKMEKTIRKDLGARSNYSKYFAAKEMQDDLFNVCKAYALYDEEVGYAQGMNFIVMPLLFNMPAEEAFCLLAKLMNNYNLRETFIQDMPGLHRQLFQFERLLEDTDGKLYRHLNKRGVTPSLYATQWFITLFAYKFPLQLVLRVYDLILSEGLQSAVLKFGIALMQKNSDKLLAIHDMAALKTFLNEKIFDAYIDSSPSSRSILDQGFFGSSGGSEKDVYRADLLVQDACAIPIASETLKEYADEYESKMKAEKERQAELEELRATVASQSTKIRSLEERVEKSDTEHVQITQEMIRSRMENEEMKTSGHEQLAEIERLKKELEAAPDKVETSLKEDMERTITRNTEVQSQNRMLEEQMAEMEKALVETKMQFAQVNSDHETLKQKWSDLRKALGD